MHLLVLILCLLPADLLSFSPIVASRHAASKLTALPAKDVWILPSEQDVTLAVHKILVNAANRAIAERGHFALAIPGGSVLNVLSSLDTAGQEWVSKTTLAYVNHKCVPNDDAKNSIHAKAQSMFLERWGLDNVVKLDGTDNAKAEADSYQAKLEAIPETILPRDTDSFPVFDLCLIGVGDDGHIGSLYPNRDELLERMRWTIGVEMKTPPSISLTLPVMQRAKQSVVAAAGKSEKYPKGKASAMRLAVEDPDITPSQFPACALRQSAIWILDEPNASEMPSLKRSTLDEVLLVAVGA